jgi:hypothetical protein
LTLKTWNVGDVLTASDMNSWVIGQVVAKPSDESRASTTTLTADSHYSFAVAANSVYRVTGLLAYSADPAGDLKMSWTVPAGASTNIACVGPATTATATVTSGTYQRVASILMGGVIDNTVIVVAKVDGICRTGGTAGTLALTWAQNASSASATIMRSDGFIEVRLVA